jgi:outer membrane lipoprotein-sorting protein
MKTALRLLALAALVLAAPAFAQNARELARVNAYLNSLDLAQGSFVQISPNGETSDGKFFIRRPGRIRFEYTPPNPTLVVSDGVWVVVFDLRTCDQQTVPLNQTPLDLLLRERVNLAAEGVVRKVEKDGGQLRITAINPKDPDQGTMTMIFSDNPLELRQWVVTDAQGQATTVILNSMQRGVSADTSQFLPKNIELSQCAKK